MIARRYTFFGLLLVVALHGAFAAPVATRETLLGAWRLVRIEYRDASGKTIDPYYQPGSSGLLIYDSSGWMSVQILAPGRGRARAADVRVPPPKDTAAGRLHKATAFDTAYSYYGKWEFDPGASVVTHDVTDSLVPAESGASYQQTVSLESGHLVFTNRSGPPGGESVRRKIWQRVAD